MRTHTGFSSSYLRAMPPAVPIPLQPLHFLLANRSVPLTQAFQVVGDNRVAVLVCSIGDLAHELDLGEVLDVQRHREQGVPEYVVDGREIPQMPEVKTDVLAVMRPSDALFKQDAVGRKLPVAGSARAPRPAPLLCCPGVAVPLDVRAGVGALRWQGLMPVPRALIGRHEAEIARTCQLSSCEGYGCS